ncbi:MAG: hypothetical protein AAGJ46_13305 [Planctomycetota bacterium]
MAMIPSALSRPATVFFALAALASALPLVNGQSITLQLDLRYTDPIDASQGGTWQVSAASSNAGIAALNFVLTGVDSGVTELVPSGTVNGGDEAGFDFFSVFSVTDGVQVVTNQVSFPLSGTDPTGVFFGVGTQELGSPTQSTFDSPSNIPWANPAVRFDSSLTTFAPIAEGTFPAGSIPEFSTTIGDLTGQVYRSTSLAEPIGDISPSIQPSTSVNAMGNLVQANGDFNGDNVIDMADFTVWRDNLGNNVGIPGIAGDGNFDGVVDLADYELWKTNFGMMGTQAMQPIPEPQTGALAILATALVGTLRPRKQGVLGRACVGPKNTEYVGKLLDTPKTRSHNASSR